jgi:methionine-S-sulfoxide reductase
MILVSMILVVSCFSFMIYKFNVFALLYRTPDSAFSSMAGVTEVVVGYTGGVQEWPTYRSMKDHSEAVRVTFDPRVISYEGILQAYFRQNGCLYGNRGSRQYRSAILVHNDEQRQAVASTIEDLNKNSTRKIQLDVENATAFYYAEEYHQKYNDKNRY